MKRLAKPNNRSSPRCRSAVTYCTSLARSSARSKRATHSSPAKRTLVSMKSLLAKGSTTLTSAPRASMASMNSRSPPQAAEE